MSLIKSSLASFILSTSPSNSISKGVLNSSPKPRQLPPMNLKKTSDNESLIKNQNSIKLSNKHPLLRSFHSVDRQELSLHDESSLNRSFKRLEAAIRYIGPCPGDKDLLENTITESLLPIRYTKIRTKCRSVDLAMEKCRDEEISIWVKKKGTKTESKNKAFQEFLADLFDALDEDQNGKITPDEFIMPLLAYGTSSDPEYIEKALVEVFGKSIEKISIEKESFLNVFSEDQRTEFILGALEKHTRAYLNDQEKKRAARRKSLNIISRTETRIDDVVPKVYCTMNQYMTVVKKWWKDLFSANKKASKDDKEKINKSKFLEFILNKGLVSNKIEALRLTSASEALGTVDYVSFERIFLKALIKSALLNLAEGLNNCKFSGNESMNLRLSKCQRRFMISGVAPKNTELSIQGKQALDSLSKYQSEHKNNYRNRAMNDVKGILQKAEEEAEDRLHGYLYKISEDAEKFLDNWGTLLSGQNTWEIREKFRNSFERSN